MLLARASLELVLTSFHLLLSYATWLCVFGFLCLRFGFWIFYDSLFIYLFIIIETCSVLVGLTARSRSLLRLALDDVHERVDLGGEEEGLDKGAKANLLS